MGSFRSTSDLKHRDMSDPSKVPVGVKVLADHLVKVKLSYEEQIYQLLTKLKEAKKENDDLKKQMNQMEEELEERRMEIFQFKREYTDHWRIEERENWKSALNQVQRERKRLAEENDQLKTEISEYKQKIRTLEENMLKSPLSTSKEIHEDPSYNFSPVVDGPPLSIQQLLSEEKSSEEESKNDAVPSPTTTPDSVSSQVINRNDVISRLSDSDSSSEEEEEKNQSATNEKGNHSKYVTLNALPSTLPLKKVPLFPKKETNTIQTEPNHQDQNSNRIDALLNQIEQMKQEFNFKEYQIKKEKDDIIEDLNNKLKDYENSLEALKLKLDSELELKWELQQQLKDEREKNKDSSFFSFLWG